MVRQAVPWHKKHSPSKAPDPHPAIEQTSGDPPKVRPHNSIQYGHVVRLADDTYEYLRAMRQRIIDRIRTGADRDVVLLPALGKLIDVALREYGTRHGVEPQAAAR